LTRAQVQLANWKNRRGRPVRFRNLYVSRNVKLSLDNTKYACDKLTETTIRISAPPSYMMTGALESARCSIVQTDINGDLIEDTLMAMFVAPDPLGTYVDIHFREEITASTSAVVSTEVTFAFDRFKIMRGTPQVDTPYMLLPTSFRNILKVTEATGTSALAKPASKANLYNPLMTTGTPSQWYQLGDIIYFDTYFEEPLWFVVEYQKLPDELRSLTQPFEIPDQWHDVLLLLVEWETSRRAQENDMASRIRTDIDRLIDSLRIDAEEEHLRTDTGGIKLRKD